MALLQTSEHHGVSLSSVGIGTWTIGGPYWTNGQPTGWGGQLDDRDSVAGLQAAIAGGITHIDTADAYGHGRSERLVGQAVHGYAAGLTLASKVGWLPTSAPSVFTPENIRFQLDQSLRNLGVDHLDIYYAHHCDFGPDDIFLKPAVEEFRKLKAEGLIRAIGLSGYSADDLIRVGTVMQPDFIQSWASIEHPEFIDDDGALATFMKEHDIRFVAMMPFGQGRLLGKLSSAKPPVFGEGDNREGNAEFSAESLAAFEPKLQVLKDHFGPRPADLMVPALGFILKHPVVASVIPGFRSSAQVRDLLTAVQRDYSDVDHELVLRTFPADQRSPHPWTA